MFKHILGSLVRFFKAVKNYVKALDLHWWEVTAIYIIVFIILKIVFPFPSLVWVVVFYFVVFYILVRLAEAAFDDGCR